MKTIVASLAAAALLTGQAVAAPVERTPTPVGQAEQAEDTTLWIVLGVLVAGLIILLIAADDDDDEEPVSP